MGNIANLGNTVLSSVARFRGLKEGEGVYVVYSNAPYIKPVCGQGFADFGSALCYNWSSVN